MADGKTAEQANPLDECYCGDYRRQHKDGIGPCQLCSWNHPPGMEPCQSFRLSRAASRIKEASRENSD